jgi:DNA-binding CsgD family transcriptional regulator
MRERQILYQVQRGLINKEIGQHLGIEEDTVKKHLRNMYAKLGVHRRAQMLLRIVGESRASVWTRPSPERAARSGDEH